MGIVLVPLELIRTLPHAPMVKPLLLIVEYSGPNFPLVWAFGSLGLWLLLLRRIYNFHGLWTFVKKGHLPDFQPPPVSDTPQARMTASMLRLE